MKCQYFCLSIRQHMESIVIAVGTIELHSSQTLPHYQIYANNASKCANLSHGMCQCVAQLTVFPSRRSFVDADETTRKTMVMPPPKNSIIAFRYFVSSQISYLRMASPSRIDYPPVERDCDDLPRDELGNVANIQRCQFQFPIPIHLRQGYDG